MSEIYSGSAWPPSLWSSDPIAWPTVPPPDPWHAAASLLRLGNGSWIKEALWTTGVFHVRILIPPRRTNIKFEEKKHWWKLDRRGFFTCVSPLWWWLYLLDGTVSYWQHLKCQFCATWWWCEPSDFITCAGPINFWNVNLVMVGVTWVTWLSHLLQCPLPASSWPPNRRVALLWPPPSLQWWFESKSRSHRKQNQK